MGAMRGFVTIYLFFGLIFRAMGCLIPLLIFIGVSGYIVYSVGGFDGGIKNTKANLTSFLSGDKEIVEKKTAPVLNAQPIAVQPKQESFNPRSFPEVTAKAIVLRADVLQFFNGQYIKLYGIEAPDLNQTCTNKQGRTYFCGKQAAAWLKSWIKDYDLKCHIIKTDAKNNSLAVCFLGPYEVAAATAQAGWALATQDIYKAYENSAKEANKGLWQGRFHRPKKWRESKTEKGL